MKGKFLLVIVIGLAVVYLSSMMENPHTGASQPGQGIVFFIGLGVIGFSILVFGLCKLFKNF